MIEMVIMKKIAFLLLFFGIVNYVFPQNVQLPILNIKAYLNDNEISGPIYQNIYQPPIQGTDYLGSFVRLTSIFGLLGAEIKIYNGIIEINGEKTGNIRINYINQNNVSVYSSLRGGEINERLTNNSIVLINNEYFINIGNVRYLINGALQQEDDRVILYTNDYERVDIPLTLNDCFLALDNLLNNEVKEDIKSSEIRDLIRYHMTLGMWIRNNWLRQSNNRITGVLFNNGIRHLDDMSQIIISGYHYYLNGINKSIEGLKNM
jgi:hypothetical protein